jgi:small subunit ribosomal protein S20
MAKLKTGRHTSAIKSHRQSEKRSLSNRLVRRTIRTLAKELQAAALRKDAKAVEELTRKVSSAWDKAAKIGVVHWKAAARKKSRLAQMAKTASAPAKAALAPAKAPPAA